MERVYSLSRPDLFTIIEGERSWRGADQAWYTDQWQRKAGCGPTCAAELVRYLAAARPDCKALYPGLSWEKDAAVALMNELWQFITPGRMGVNTLHPFTAGLSAFATSKGVALPIRQLDVPPLKVARPTIDQCAAFLRTAISADCPVAFLNLSAGQVEGLDSWHWVTIIAVEAQGDGPLQCTVLDGGKELKIDFRLWFQTTRAGGGLVYIPTA